MENRGGAGAKSIGDKGEAAAAAYLEKEGYSRVNDIGGIHSYRGETVCSI